nr:uncharacterized protein LOC111753194 [Loxodonta africana]
MDWAHLGTSEGLGRGLTTLPPCRKDPWQKAPRLSPRSRQRAFPKPVVESVAQPAEKRKPEDSQVSKESDEEPKLDRQPEPTIRFLFTLLNTSEATQPKDPEDLGPPPPVSDPLVQTSLPAHPRDSKIQECPFLDKEDWGPQRTSMEISHLREDCERVWESLSRTKVDNVALGERLQNLVRPSALDPLPLWPPPCLPAQLGTRGASGVCPRSPPHF